MCVDVGVYSLVCLFVFICCSVSGIATGVSVTKRSVASSDENTLHAYDIWRFFVSFIYLSWLDFSSHNVWSDPKTKQITRAFTAGGRARHTFAVFVFVCLLRRFGPVMFVRMHARLHFNYVLGCARRFIARDLCTAQPNSGKTLICLCGWLALHVLTVFDNSIRLPSINTNNILYQPENMTCIYTNRIFLCCLRFVATSTTHNWRRA